VGQPEPNLPARGAWRVSLVAQAKGQRAPECVLRLHARGCPGRCHFLVRGYRIQAIGIATSFAYEAPKPIEFGNAGAYWDLIGWRVDVRFIRLSHSIRPADSIDLIRPLLPDRYAPLLPDGRGLQAVYLTHVPKPLAELLMDLVGDEARAIVQGYVLTDTPAATPAIGLAEWEEHELDVLRQSSIETTTRQALVLARRGQGIFKANVARIEKACRITKVAREEHLIASHCKPWRDSTNEERLDGENGLLLTPNADHLFDRGFISFENNGDLLVSPVVHTESLQRLGIDPLRRMNVGRFTDGQKRYLDFHRENVLLMTRYLND
jgi:putative restriction endonuclease